jgi:membrane protein
MAITTADDIWDVAVDVKDRIGEDRVFAVAAGVAFYGLLAVFPAITAMISLFGLVASPAEVPGQLAQITSALPDEAAVLLTEQATEIAAKAGGALTLGAVIALAVALWSAMSGTKALIEAVGIAYDADETRGFVQLNLLALTFTLGGMALIPALALTIGVLPVILGGLAASTMETVVLVLRWPLVFAVMLVVLGVLYQRGPDRKRAAFRWITPGAVAASVGLLVTSSGFSFYASNFSSYDETYGSLAAVVVLMLWIWLSTVVVLIGALINAELERRRGAGLGASLSLAR